MLLLLNSEVVINLAVLSISFTIFVGSVLRFVARFLMPDILLSVSAAFVFKAAFIATLVISGILF